ncbi:MAG: putative sulfate exporter family transporter [Deltaproteobacteria bacterium]|nr:putative sulfate exporter family transporter [Deltaproteobacteria bacterium]
MPENRGRWSEFYLREDWWAVWLGLGIVIVSFLLYGAGHAETLVRFAVQPPKWSEAGKVGAHFAECWMWYLVLFGVFLAVFTGSAALMGHGPRTFVPGFAVIFAGSVVILVLSNSGFAQDYNLEAPLLALLVGLLVGNIVKMPDWLQTSLRTEYYIKTGIVLLGATLPLTLIASAGPIAFLQATIVSVTTWLTMYFTLTRVFKKSPQFAAVLGAAGSVCGVSASIAVGAAVKAKKEEIAVSISVVTIWAIVMIFFIPLASRGLGLPTAQAGAWVGTSEFADAAGFAAASAYAPAMPADLTEAVRADKAGAATDAQKKLLETRYRYDTENAIRAFTLMKVIGRDIWIGIWCFILSIVAVVYWEKKEGGGSGRVGAGVIWDRFPKFVLGFIAASILMTLIVKFYADPSAAAQKALKNGLIAPIKVLRTWTFVLTFLCIGLTTRFRDLTKFGAQPFYAFTIGVLVNVPLGYLLSVHLFGDFWLALR